MPIIITLLAVTALLVFIVLLKWHPFVALILVAILTGLALGMPAADALASITSGVGGTLGGLALILGLGAALGGVIAETGAAQVITDRLHALCLTHFGSPAAVRDEVGLEDLIWSVVSGYQAKGEGRCCHENDIHWQDAHVP